LAIRSSLSLADQARSAYGCSPNDVGVDAVLGEQIMGFQASFFLLPMAGKLTGYFGATTRTKGSNEALRVWKMHHRTLIDP
jgi:hypothetical protein